MDRRERANDALTGFLAAMRGNQSDLWTALPGIIESFSPDEMTCSVQPAIQILFTSPVDNSQTWETMPICTDCPVLFQGGGGCTLTFPIKQGDECLILFANRCIDAWWQQGGVRPQATLRMHDLSDGFVLVGVRSQPRVISGISTTATQLRSDDGNSFLEINSTSHQIKLRTTGNLVADVDGALTATVDGNVTVNAGGNLQATVGGTTAVASTGAMTLTAPSISLNGFTIDGSGNATAPTGATVSAPNIAGTSSVKAAGKELAGHNHNDAHGGVTGGNN